MYKTFEKGKGNVEMKKAEKIPERISEKAEKTEKTQKAEVMPYMMNRDSKNRHTGS